MVTSDPFVGYPPTVTIGRAEYISADDVKETVKINVPDEKIKDNIRVNCNSGWQMIRPYDRQETEVMLLAGGPSLNDFEADIREKREAGMPLITTNGSYHWALDRGLVPSAQIMVDARPFNKRFLEPVVDNCKYLIASQCDPEAIKHLPKDRTYIWHSASDDEALDYIRSVQDGFVWPVPGGSTVILRSLMLLQAIGYFKIHVYGFDSCIMEAHHAYEQKENDGDVLTLKVKTKHKEFVCTPWMAVQAKEFRQMADLMDESVELAVYGDGLIATMIREAAE